MNGTAFEVFETETFSKLFESLEHRERIWVGKMRVQLKTNPKSGKPLRYTWFREKKFENKRLYYLVSEKKMKIILAAFGSKKDQQRIIDQILLNKTEYLELLEKI